MKIIFITIIFIFISPVSAETTEEFQSQVWYAKFEKKIATSHAKGKEGLDALSHSLRYFGGSVHSCPDPRWQRCYYLAQDALISIPGHARYFTDQFEAMRPTREKSEYYRFRDWYFYNTFPHIPSPEMIQVLGHYLDDFRDSNSPNLPLEERTVMIDSHNPNEANRKKPNAWYASYALLNIGLRDFPHDIEMVSPRSKGSLEYWRKARAWYQEVKSGQRAFSFRGKSVEYRFKPDGTWDTISIKNPPQDAIVYPNPEAVQAIANRQKLEAAKAEAEHAAQEAAEQKKNQQEKRKKLGWWVAGLSPLLLFGLLWWRKKMKTQHA